MKKVLAILLAVLLCFSVSTVAFAAGNYAEEAACSSIRVYCEKCETCTGKFGCNCCEECPGYIDFDGNAVNLAKFSGCRLDSYYDVDKYDDNNNVVHKGDYTVHYYWKALCCEKCTGKHDCKCNDLDDKQSCGCPSCAYLPSHIDEDIESAIDSGREGYTKGIQAALESLRKVLYNFFDKLFEFLRLEEILGKKPVVSK